jgi:hypothetical protein
MFLQLINTIIDTFKQDPRTKVFVDETTLLAAAEEETGSTISVNTLREIIAKYISGDLDSDEEAIYDGAIYACSHAASKCFGENSDDDVDYELDWILNSDNSYSAEVRPLNA